MSRKDKIVEMLEKNPEDSFLLHALALEHIAVGEKEQAIHAFEQLLKINPGYTGSYYHLAALYSETGCREQAEQTYRTGMEQATKAGELRAYNELQSALHHLLEEDDQ
ncbi:MAG TPA: tetratricopeptide repeat protein [Ferruginibacter sp.]|nr:tetratricopeptide repeat protein [Ferruginibacter sp.]HRO17874.1 tetratricopeptide repeat protein [Ferruginibacter sp.]HRQ20809.1 tetratricopeptide repeat protein [Ferruginibacter sp.]